MRSNKKYLAMIALMSLLFNSCGGGGSTSNSNPIVDAGNQYSIMLNNTITLIGSATDIDGDTLSYEWSENSTVLAKTQLLEYTPMAVGTHILDLKVSDGRGGVAIDTVIIETREASECDPLIQLLDECQTKEKL
ncbi:MAG: hypothetical protein U9N49_09965 [Campylobacterota bacterium]|nr:hypothetical protein [Campylobacterota bacterium]